MSKTILGLDLGTRTLGIAISVVFIFRILFPRLSISYMFLFVNYLYIFSKQFTYQMSLTWCSYMDLHYIILWLFVRIFEFHIHNLTLDYWELTLWCLCLILLYSVDSLEILVHLYRIDNAFRPYIRLTLIVIGLFLYGMIMEPCNICCVDVCR